MTYKKKEVERPIVSKIHSFFTDLGRLLLTILRLTIHYRSERLTLHIYSELAASPRRRGLTVALRLCLRIFKQSLHDCDSTYLTKLASTVALPN